MGQPSALTEAERERIYQGRLTGKTVSVLATELGRSRAAVRKWGRRLRDEGVSGLRTRRRGRPRQGVLAQFDSRVVQAARGLKQTHHGWGADRVLVELRQDTRWRGLALPSRSRLAAFFKEQCPECLARHQARPPAPAAPPPATAAHAVWQLDNQEKVELADGEIAVICSIRDPFSAAIIASQAFAAKTAKHWRKLTWSEIRDTLRAGFAEWQTLPDSVLTDNELVLAGTPGDPFPSKLTLWLRGLGIVHRFIRPHCPTDQPQIERTHRILDGFTLDADSRTDVPHLQLALAQARHVYNELFPCRASDCDGHPPLVAHPELRYPRRPYHPAHELALFDIQRVYAFLAEFTFTRHVSTTGVVSLGRCLYSIGRSQAGKCLQVRFDPIHREWVFVEQTRPEDATEEQELARRGLKQFDVWSLTGLAPVALPAPPAPLQLSLPCLG
jgi:biotin operon repressor